MGWRCECDGVYETSYYILIDCLGKSLVSIFNNVLPEFSEFLPTYFLTLTMWPKSKPWEKTIKKLEFQINLLKTMTKLTFYCESLKD